jgi:hypothetical protein
MLAANPEVAAVSASVTMAVPNAAGENVMLRC